MINIKAKAKEEGYQTEISNEEHLYLVDEPIEVGGTNLGFKPTELLAASLASCTSITIKMYAKRKEWQIDKLEVDVTYDKNSETNIHSFERILTIEGNLSEKELERLKSVANACPVHKILEGTVKINTHLKK